MTKRPLPVICSALALALLATTARADDAACASQEAAGLRDNPASIVIPQLAPTCYGVSEEKQPLTQQVRALIDKDPTFERLAGALRTLATHVGASSVYGAQAQRDAFVARANAAAEDVARQLPAGQADASPLFWQIENGRVMAVPGLDIVSALNAACPSAASSGAAACKTAIDSAKAWFRAVQLVDTTLSIYSKPGIQELLTRSTNRLAMWHAYRDEGLPQFQWEWLVNSWRLNKSDKGPDGRARDAAGQPIGPMKVPTDQIIVLHPGVGLEYRESPDEQPTSGNSVDSHTAPIVYLELLGRYRWSWNETSGKMIGGSGVSIITTYADRDNDTQVGYGLLFHSRFTKSYKLGITRSGDTTNLIFNIDLADFFKDKLSYWKDVEEEATK